MGAQESRIRLAVTSGDPFGVGPEVALRAAAEVAAPVRFYGDPDVLADAPDLVPVPIEGERPDTPGPSVAGGRAAVAALRRALDDLAAGEADALVTGPVSRESCRLAGLAPDGQTPLLGRFYGVSDPLRCFVWDEAEPVVALLLGPIPYRAVPSALASERVEAAVHGLRRALRGAFGRERARIAVLGLNPHAGEGGWLGTEEEDHLAPAIRRLRALGHDVLGPLPADRAFAVREGLDGILAIHHDQGLAPVRALGSRTAVGVTLGLPVVRTAPVHGAAFDTAGSGRADPTAMREAMRWALRLARRGVGPGSR